MRRLKEKLSGLGVSLDLPKSFRVAREEDYIPHFDQLRVIFAELDTYIRWDADPKTWGWTTERLGELAKIGLITFDALGKKQKKADLVIFSHLGFSHKSSLGIKEKGQEGMLTQLIQIGTNTATDPQVMNIFEITRVIGRSEILIGANVFQTPLAQLESGIALDRRHIHTFPLRPIETA